MTDRNIDKVACPECGELAEMDVQRGLRRVGMAVWIPFQCPKGHRFDHKLEMKELERRRPVA